MQFVFTTIISIIIFMETCCCQIVHRRKMAQNKTIIFEKKNKIEKEKRKTNKVKHAMNICQNTLYHSFVVARFCEVLHYLQCSAFSNVQCCHITQIKSEPPLLVVCMYNALTVLAVALIQSWNAFYKPNVTNVIPLHSW